MSLDSLAQNTLIINSQKRIFQPGDAFEDTTFEPGFDIVKL